MNLVKESLYEFKKGVDPLETMNLGANADPLMKLYNYFKSNNFNVTYPDENTIFLINKHKIHMYIEKINNKFFDIYVEDVNGDNVNDIPLAELTYQEVIDNVDSINNWWIEENRDNEEY